MPPFPLSSHGQQHQNSSPRYHLLYGDNCPRVEAHQEEKLKLFPRTEGRRSVQYKEMMNLYISMGRCTTEADLISLNANKIICKEMFPCVSSCSWAVGFYLQKKKNHTGLRLCHCVFHFREKTDFIFRNVFQSNERPRRVFFFSFISLKRQRNSKILSVNFEVKVST